MPKEKPLKQQVFELDIPIDKFKQMSLWERYNHLKKSFEMGKDLKPILTRCATKSINAFINYGLRNDEKKFCWELLKFVEARKSKEAQRLSERIQVNSRLSSEDTMKLNTIYEWNLKNNGLELLKQRLSPAKISSQASLGKLILEAGLNHLYTLYLNDKHINEMAELLVDDNFIEGMEERYELYADPEVDNYLGFQLEEKDDFCERAASILNIPKRLAGIFFQEALSRAEEMIKNKNQPEPLDPETAFRADLFAEVYSSEKGK